MPKNATMTKSPSQHHRYCLTPGGGEYQRLTLQAAKPTYWEPGQNARCATDSTPP